MKTIFPIDKIPHLWIHRAQHNARNAQGNFYFDGPAIYSYSDKCVLGYILPAEHYGRTVLLNSGDYSVTTARHQSKIHRSIPNDCSEIYVNGLNDSDVRYIATHGASDVCAMIKETTLRKMRDACLHSIHPPKRAEHCGDVRHNARMLAKISQCDAVRKDLSSAQRKAAKKQLNFALSLVDFGLPVPDDAKQFRALVASSARAYLRAEFIARYNGQLARAIETLNDTRLPEFLIEFRRLGEFAFLANRKIPATLTVHAKKIRKIVILGQAAILAETKKHNESKFNAIAAEVDAAILAGNLELTKHAYGRAVKMSAYGFDIEKITQRHNVFKLATARERLPAFLAEIEHVRLADKIDRLESTVKKTRVLISTVSAYTPEIIASVPNCENWRDAENVCMELSALLATAKIEQAAAEHNCLAAWRNGDKSARLPYGSPVALRFSSENKIVETSHGADIPVTFCPMVNCLR